MDEQLLARAEKRRKEALLSQDPKSQSDFGQYFTPSRAATLIASLAQLPQSGHVRVLDPGAGSGMLTAALCERLMSESEAVTAHIVAVEADPTVVPFLRDTLDDCAAASDGRFSYEVIEGDYVALGTAHDERVTGMDLVIQNPPYKKLSASSDSRKLMRKALVDTPNIYAAFLALGTAALNPGGQLVAITPRSFCNGPYFGDFRSYLLKQLALDRVHVFESRSTVFADTGVLQENVIFAGTLNGERDEVQLSVSIGHEDTAEQRIVPYKEVVHADDPHQFIRIVTDDESTQIAEVMLAMPETLESIGVKASTGKVVDFRSKRCLRNLEARNAAPLIYPGNLRHGAVEWPRAIRKPQWFDPQEAKDHALLMPEGWYCLVKRFSAKEEKRRVVASVWSPEAIPGKVAFENHLNVFHVGGAGLDRDLAYGLATWLNSSVVDKFFRTFSGHTQVNATDLRTMRFPSLERLRAIGALVGNDVQDQNGIDRVIVVALG